MSQTENEVGRRPDERARRYEQRDLADLEDLEPRAIERRIDATRADMRATLEALERRLSFDRLVELTIGRVRERGGEFAGNLTDAATQNPVPLLLTSIGLGWMMLTSRRASHPPSYSHASDAADGIHGAMDSTRESLQHSAESLRSSAAHSAESLRSGAARAAEATREQYEYAREQVAHARERADRLLEEQPLMLGAIGLAAGAILGAWLPTTEHENRWVGDVREKAVRTAADRARRSYDSAREHAAAYSAPAGGRDEESAREQATQRPH